MLVSSMDHLNYYGVPKDNFLELDPTASNGPYSLHSSAGGSVEDNQTAHNQQAYMNEESSPKNGTKSSLYKTELCKRFSEFGNCRYGAKCQFAHGVSELRHVVRHPKYKTTKCKSYWGSGHCPYGSRCRFIHDETEALQSSQYETAMFNDSTHPLASNNADLVPPTPGSYSYDQAAEQANNGLSAYAHEYPVVVSSYDKSTWNHSQQPQPRLNYPAGQYPSSKAMAPNGSSASQSTRSSSPGYPDLQDAIDALMKFSLSPTEMNEPPPKRGLVLPSPDHSIRLETPLKRAEYAFDPDALWKDFPSLDTSNNQDSDEMNSKPWSASILSLNLDGSSPPAKGDQNNQLGSDSSSPKGENSPRLSVFERFH